MIPAKRGRVEGKVTMAGHDHAIHAHGHGSGESHHAHSQEINAGLVVRWFVGILVFVVSVVVIITVYFVSVTSRVRAEIVETTIMSKDANAAKASAEAMLGINGNPKRFTWSDAKAGLVQMPIDEAMKRVETKYMKGSSEKATAGSK
jgi:hypothetical protein